MGVIIKYASTHTRVRRRIGKYTYHGVTVSEGLKCGRDTSSAYSSSRNLLLEFVKFLSIEVTIARGRSAEHQFRKATSSVSHHRSKSMFATSRPAAVVLLAALLLVSRAVEARNNFFLPIWKQHDTGKGFGFMHPGFSITITKGVQEEGAANNPLMTTTATTSSTAGANGAGSSVQPEAGKIKIVMESGNPTLVTPDGNRVPVPRGQVVYITPPSGPNGSPGIQGPEQPGGARPASPDKLVTVWNPNGPRDGQPDTPVVITPDGIPLRIVPNQPGLEVFWPDIDNPPVIKVSPMPDGNGQVVPQQANLDCSDIAGTYSWACTCNGKCRSEIETWVWEGWHPVRAVIAADCSLQMTMQNCVTGGVGTGSGQVRASGTHRAVLAPAQSLCPPGWRCEGLVTVDLPGYSAYWNSDGLNCRVTCQPSRGLPPGIRSVPRAEPRPVASTNSVGPGPSTPPPTGGSTPPPGPKNPPPPGGQTPPTAGNFKDSMLDETNKLRSQHGAQPLKWDDKLASEAQAWADKCTGGHDESLKNSPIGENMAGQISGQAPAEAARGAADTWYDEHTRYQPAGSADPACGQTSDSDHTCRHFTQLVWKSADRLGCGYNPKCQTVSAIVCRYAGGQDPGNMATKYAQNVQ